MHNNCMRKNVTIIAKMHKDSFIIPLSLVWDDEKTYQIDKVLDIKKKASLKGGGMGTRYTCKISNQEKYIWLDGFVWFVEL